MDDGAEEEEGSYRPPPVELQVTSTDLGGEENAKNE